METVVILIVVGAVLLFLETLLPGLIAGVLGLCSVIAGVVMAYANFGLRAGNFTLLVVASGLVAGTLAYLRYFPGSRAARVFVSQQQVGDLGTERPELLHETGSAFTQLRPSGVAILKGQRVDVVAEGPLIERGAAVKVVAVEGARVVVRQLPNDQSLIST